MLTKKTTKIVMIFALFALVLTVGSALAVSGAAFTTFNPSVDGSGKDICKNSIINCNIYGAKEYVWLNGGPDANGLGPDGQYFFTVLEPGGQPNPNDQGSVADKNLSDDYDCYLNRTFTVTNGEVSAYTGDDSCGDPYTTFTDPHWLDSNTQAPDGCKNGNGPQACDGPDNEPPYIRLFPYTDTTNPGGVYILAICSLADGYPVVPRDCKYDAFKVKEGRVTYDFLLDGYKYLDLDMDGELDDGEYGLENWEITIEGTGFLGEEINTSILTDADGYWIYQSVEYTFKGQDKPQTAYLTVCEVLQDGWVQSGPATVCYDLEIDPEGVTYVPGLNFFNYPQGDISGGKYYDTNENGQWDEGEPWLPGWEITYDSSSVFTGLDGMFMVTVDPGTYDFTEIQGYNNGTNGWFQTGNTVDQSTTSGGATVSLANFAYEVTIPSTQPSTVDGLYFGNVCKIAPGGRTPGFWQNNNGQALLSANLGWLNDLAVLNLVDEQGNPFDPATPEEVASWILSDAGQNMAWKLSSFVAANTLNVLAGFTDPDVSVYYDGAWYTVQGLLDYADGLLGDYPYTPSGDPNRVEQEAVKNILDDVANGYSFVQPSPGDACGVPYPTP